MIRLYIAGAVAAAVLAGTAWWGHGRYQEGAQSVRAEWAISDARLADEARVLAVQRATTIERIDHVAVAEIRAVRSAAVYAAVAGGGLRFRAEAVAARCDPGPAGSSETTPSSGALLADVLGRLEAAGRDLAATADERGVAGAACEAAFDAVKGAP